MGATSESRNRAGVTNKIAASQLNALDMNSGFGMASRGAVTGPNETYSVAPEYHGNFMKQQQQQMNSRSAENGMIRPTSAFPDAQRHNQMHNISRFLRNANGSEIGMPVKQAGEGVPLYGNALQSHDARSLLPETKLLEVGRNLPQQSDQDETMGPAFRHNVGTSALGMYHLNDGVILPAQDTSLHPSDASTFSAAGRYPQFPNTKQAAFHPPPPMESNRPGNDARRHGWQNNRHTALEPSMNAAQYNTTGRTSGNHKQLDADYVAANTWSSTEHSGHAVRYDENQPALSANRNQLLYSPERFLPGNEFRPNNRPEHNRNWQHGRQGQFDSSPNVAADHIVSSHQRPVGGGNFPSSGYGMTNENANNHPHGYGAQPTPYGPRHPAAISPPLHDRHRPPGHTQFGGYMDYNNQNRNPQYHPGTLPLLGNGPPPLGRPFAPRGALGAMLRPIDWSTQRQKQPAFLQYVAPPSVQQRPEEEVAQILKANDISVFGSPPMPKPVTTFEEATFPPWILAEITAAGYEAPYPIQMMGWPITRSGRDMIGIAQTGSGKTLAYILPALLHTAAHGPLKPGEGPIVLVLAPTRELSMQIEKETLRFAPRGGIRVACIYGGVNRRSQANLLTRGVEVCVATPGRLIDFLEVGYTNLKSVSYFVLDEADRMLDMGFEPQIRSVVSQINPVRQTLMWSATWPKQVRLLARDFCREATVTVVVGSHELQANNNIDQIIIPTGRTREEKFQLFAEWLMRYFPPQGRCLVFCETKRGCENLRNAIYRARIAKWNVLCIHGDKEQHERDRVLQSFKTGHCQVLIATDVASRGLDIKSVECVVNYDVPKTIEDYIHRIGRTGRAGLRGSAITFFESDPNISGRMKMAQKICQVMRDVGQLPPSDLVAFANLKPLDSEPDYNDYRYRTGNFGGDHGGGRGRRFPPRGGRGGVGMDRRNFAGGRGPPGPRGKGMFNPSYI